MRTKIVSVRRQNNRHIPHHTDDRHMYPASVVNFALGAEESGLNRKLSRDVITPPPWALAKQDSGSQCDFKQEMITIHDSEPISTVIEQEKEQLLHEALRPYVKNFSSLRPDEDFQDDA
jgi:hypothetical protein